MDKKFILNSGRAYNRKDFQTFNLLKNESLLNELDMKHLPETFLEVFGVECIDAYKPILVKKIELYDKSQAVNSFLYEGNMYWLDKQQRSGLKTIADSGLETITLVFGTKTISLSSSRAKQFLQDLEVYAYKCFINTAMHRQKALQLLDPKDIINYDYTSGYPEKIVLQ